MTPYVHPFAHRSWSTPGLIAVISLCTAFLASCSESAAPPPPVNIANVAVVRGDRQTTVVGTQFPAPIVIRVTDSLGRPAIGTVAVYALAGTIVAPHSRIGDTVATNANGLASFVLGAGGDAGEQRVEVTVQSLNAPPNNMSGYVANVTLSETATPGPFDHPDTRYGTQPFLFGEPIPVLTVLKPLDAFGNSTQLPPGAMVSVSGGGQVTDGVIVPPAPDYEGQLVVRLATAANTYVDTVSRFVSLRTPATVSYKCVADASGPVTDFGAVLDSLSVSGTARAVYPKDPDYLIGQKTGVPFVPGIQVHMTGYAVRYPHAGVADSVPLAPNIPFLVSVLEQRRDTLVLPVSATRPSGSQYAVRVSGPPNRYVGGSWCQSAWPVRAPVVIQQH